jgi:hypothetical protein
MTSIARVQIGSQPETKASTTSADGGIMDASTNTEMSTRSIPFHEKTASQDLKETTYVHEMRRTVVVEDEAFNPKSGN